MTYHCVEKEVMEASAVSLSAQAREHELVPCSFATHHDAHSCGLWHQSEISFCRFCSELIRLGVAGSDTTRWCAEVHLGARFSLESRTLVQHE
jgi:hypothetical protein